MYCSSCGSTVPPSLTYCNRCGTKVSGSTSVSFRASTLSTESLVWAIVGLFLGGLSLIIGLMAVMKNVVGFGPGLIMAIVLLCFALMVVLHGVLIWLFLSARRDERSRIELLKERTTQELTGAQAQALHEPLTSVTDPTTRAFDPILAQRNSE